MTDPCNWKQQMAQLRAFRVAAGMKLAAGIAPRDVFGSAGEARDIEAAMASLELKMDQLCLDASARADWEACFDEVSDFRTWFVPVLHRAGYGKKP